MGAALTVAALGLFACSDAASGGGSTETGTEACTDGADNDGDGYTDCGDQDCWELVACAGAGADGGAAGAEGDTDAGALSDAADRSDATGSTGVTPADDVATSGEPDDGPTADTSPFADSAAAPDVNSEGCEPGGLQGRVCSPSEQQFVAGALISVEAAGCDGLPVHLETLSESDGTYLIEGIPPGPVEVVITKGSFSTVHNIVIQPGVVHDVTGAAYKLCFDAQAASIAVMQGSWDNMESLLSKLGLEYDRYTVTDVGQDGTILELLSDLELMGQYDIIFANCGGYHGWMPIDFPDVMPNVKAWVEAGGSLYMSDYAWVYGEWSFPDAIEFFKSDDVLDMYTEASPQMLGSGLLIPATVVDGALAGHLGKTSLTIEIDNGPQIAPQSVGPMAFGHVIGDVVQLFGDDAINATIPLVTSYVPAPGAGRVIYTNFHNDAQASDDMLTIIDYLVFTL